MRVTLLDMTQEILLKMDSDNVNSIDDTQESQSVAAIIRSTYRDILARRNYELEKTAFQFVPFIDESRPNYLKLPDEIDRCRIVRYDCGKIPFGRKHYKTLEYKHPEEFLKWLDHSNVSDGHRYEFPRDVPLYFHHRHPPLSVFGLPHRHHHHKGRDHIFPNPYGHNGYFGYFSHDPHRYTLVKEVNDRFGSIELIIRNDTAPTFWTSFDDKFIVTDSYDKRVENTLQASKSQGIGFAMPKWRHVDDFEIPLNADELQLLASEASVSCHYFIKQMANEVDASKAAFIDRRLSRANWRADPDEIRPNYGRRTWK